MGLHDTDVWSAGPGLPSVNHFTGGKGAFNLRCLLLGSGFSLTLMGKGL